MTLTKKRLLRAAIPLAGLVAGPALAQAPAQTTPAEVTPADITSLQTAPAAADAHEAGMAAAAARTPAPAGAFAYIGWPQDGTVVHSTRFKVWFGARNIGVAPAGVKVANTGHHHLLIDVPLPEDMTAPIPNDRNHLHFGAGQTETMLELPPGKHTLQLLMGDTGHVPHDPPVYSPKITIQVRPGPAARTAAAQ